MKDYSEHFKLYSVPKCVRNIAVAVMRRFVLNGSCDAMYIANLIGTTYNIGNGCDRFWDSEIPHCVRLDREAAERIQSAYKSCIPYRYVENGELIDIIRSEGQLDPDRTLNGLEEIIAQCREERASSDEVKKKYLDKVISAAHETILEIKGCENSEELPTGMVNFLEHVIRRPDDPKCAVVFTSGSHDIDGPHKDVVCGASLVYNNGSVITTKVMTDDTDEAAGYDAGGEIAAVINAVELCCERGVKEVDIYCDYEGVTKWADGEWAANNPFAIKYKDKINRLRSSYGITIWFYHWKSMSKNIANEFVDKLAKETAKSEDVIPERRKLYAV